MKGKNGQGDLFDRREELPVERPMVRTDDPDTSHETAEILLPMVGKIQRLVLEAFERHGPMTAKEAEELPEFSCYGYSTIRKRISELERAGYLEAAGVDRTGRCPMTIWRISR